MTELETSEHTTWLENPESLPERRILIREVSDPKRNSIQVNTVAFYAW